MRFCQFPPQSAEAAFAHMRFLADLWLHSMQQPMHDICLEQLWVLQPSRSTYFQYVITACPLNLAMPSTGTSQDPGHHVSTVYPSLPRHILACFEPAARLKAFADQKCHLSVTERHGLDMAKPAKLRPALQAAASKGGRHEYLKCSQEISKPA